MRTILKNVFMKIRAIKAEELLEWSGRFLAKSFSLLFLFLILAFMYDSCSKHDQNEDYNYGYYNGYLDACTDFKEKLPSSLYEIYEPNYCR